MEKSSNKSAKIIRHPKHYWAIFQGKDILFDGTFSECWTELLARFPKMTLGEAAKRGIKIARKS